MSTRIVFGGGEVPSHRKILVEAGATWVSVNYWLLRKRTTSKIKPIFTTLPEHVRMMVDPGAAQAAQALTSLDDLGAYYDEYRDFLAVNQNEVAALTEFDPIAFDLKTRTQMRNQLADEFGEHRLWPVWHHDRDSGSLEGLSEAFPHVAFTADTIKAVTTLPGRLAALKTRNGTVWHILNHARPQDLRLMHVDTVATMSWIGPMLRGETLVWDGTRLVRYSADQKDEARRRLAAVCAKAGVDHDAVMADDHKSLTRLAVWSLLQLEASMEKGGRKNQGDADVVVKLSDYKAVGHDGETEENGGALVDNRASAVERQNVPIPRPEGEKTTLPVMGFETTTVVEKGHDGHDVVREVPVARSTRTTLRQCNTCFVSANCPAYKPDNACAFDLPVEVRTKEQLKSLLQTMLEMQSSRIAFARFSEELNGGYPDPNLSTEMDRLFKLVKIVKELEQNNEFVRMTVERQTSGGVLSAIFGDKATVKPELPGGGLDADATNHLLNGDTL